LDCEGENQAEQGAPMSEHGVARNPVKQDLLRRLCGDAGVAAMQRVKSGLDPTRKLAPGVMVPPP
jgi:FAD/FMN-containing dehydrogenase